MKILIDARAYDNLKDYCDRMGLLLTDVATDAINKYVGK